MKGLNKSIEYLKGLIKKFNSNGDYHIGDELSWALDDLEFAQKDLETTKKLLGRARILNLAAKYEGLAINKESLQWELDYEEMSR